MTIDKKALKALAEAANAVTSDVNITMAVGTDPDEVKAVQDYLQQAMPRTILALLEEIERLADENENLAQCRSAVNAAVALENEALHKDAERYRWLKLQRSKAWRDAAVVPMNHTDAFIDAAMAKERGQ